MHISTNRLLKLGRINRFYGFITNYAYAKLQHQLQSINSHMLPFVVKVMVNVGVGKHKNNQQTLAQVGRCVSVITGNQPKHAKAKQSIAEFKVRKADVLGLYNTIRNKQMYAVMDQLIHFALPALHDFRGISLKALDHNCNLNLGINDCAIWPNMQGFANTGCGITITTCQLQQRFASWFYKTLGFPVRN